MSTQEKPVSPTPGNSKPRQRGFKALLTSQTLRRISQLGFASFIAVLAIQHVIVGEDSTIVTASTEAFCPFGGLETLYKFITSGGTFVSHTHLSNLVLLIAVLITALLLRSAFCGWVCPLGFIQDLVSNLGKVLKKRFSGLRRAANSLKKRSARLAVLDRYLRYLKYLVLIWSIGGSAYYGYMVFRDIDPWAALLNLAEFTFTPGIVVLVVTLVASFFVERPWCRYACPLGAVSGLVGKLSPVYVRREESTCTLCQICSNSCPVGIPVHTLKTVQHADCMSCLQCVDVCPQKDTLDIKIGLPIVGK